MTENFVYSVLVSYWDLVCELIARVKNQYSATIILSDTFSSSWLELQ